MKNGQRPILIVDDDEDLRNAVAMVLECAGYHPESASDGLTALHRLEEGLHPALVLLDLRMPGLDGIELLQRLHLKGLDEELPVVVLSGEARAREEANSLGVSGFLSKPVELDDLLSVVRQFVNV